MRRFMAGHKARLTGKVNDRLGENDGRFALAKLQSGGILGARSEGRSMSRVPDFSKLPVAPTPVQSVDVAARHPG